MHHLAYHHCSKCEINLTIFWGVLAKNPPKSSLKITVSAGRNTFENLKLQNYRSHINETCPVYATP